MTAPLVYVNYGNREDYEQLDRLGISVKGAIVIARYGQSWRGIKPKVAAEHGAIGCIIYSDPSGDGYFKGDVFPSGGWRPSTGRAARQRHGHGLSGRSVDAGRRRDHGCEAPRDERGEDPDQDSRAADLLRGCAAAAVRAQGAGGAGVMARCACRSPITWVPGPALVHLQVTSNWDIKPVYDVIATLHGSKAPEQWVIRGNHHDAWVNGADDPISGQAAMLEEARMLGELHRHGWTPSRTIIYLRVGRRRTRLAGFGRMGGDASCRAAAARRRLYQFRR